MHRNWFALFCNNSDYDIIPNIGGGDCFFITLSQSLRRSVRELRDMVAMRTTQHNYTQLRDMYMEAARNQNKDVMQDLGYMCTIHSTEGLRSFMRTSDYWADEYAIDHVEQHYRVKIMILDKRAAYAGRNPARFQLVSTPFKPRYYVILSYDGKHYELVTYRGQALFRISDLPAQVYMLFNDKNGNYRSHVHGWCGR